jgi:hypothetical protein
MRTQAPIVLMPGTAGPPSSFGKLRMRATFGDGSVENLILSLSKDEVFGS